MESKYLVFVKWLKEETGLEVVWEYQNAPRPQSNYISLYVRGRDYVGMHHETYDSTLGKSGLGYNSVINLQVRCKNDYAGSIMEKVKLSLRKESVQDLLYSESFACSYSGGVLTQPIERNGVWEHQTILEIFFNSTAETVDQTSIIETVDIEAEV